MVPVDRRESQYPRNAISKAKSGSERECGLTFPSVIIDDHLDDVLTHPIARLGDQRCVPEHRPEESHTEHRFKFHRYDRRQDQDQDHEHGKKRDKRRKFKRKGNVSARSSCYTITARKLNAWTQSNSLGDDLTTWRSLLSSINSQTAHVHIDGLDTLSALKLFLGVFGGRGDQVEVRIEVDRVP